MFTQDYMLSLPKNRIMAAYQICSDLFRSERKSTFLERPIPNITSLTDADVKEALLILEELLGDDLPYRNVAANQEGFVRQYLRSTRDGRIGRIQRIFQHLKVKILVSHVDKKNTEEYEWFINFQNEDVDRIEALLAEIRDLVSGTRDMSDDHKRRLLKIASEFHAELAKSKSSFRVFLDGLVEASEAFGEAGKKAKPAFDRFREIFNIVERRTRQAPQLEGPKEPKRLPPPSESVGD